ncbi:unnamed protein product [Linum trigynum]|uniref:Nonsense-mediated mRNA decay factor SMG8 n=1 Tax=Linum trigynum TaxID=586398 RepID=A0AAV2D461_9ROSI
MDSLNPPILRVLSRPPVPVPVPNPISGLSRAPPPQPLPPISPEPQPPPVPTRQPDSRFPSGVVVVGFVSRIPHLSSQLINRIIDANAFGSGNLAKVLFEEESREWFNRRRISYYHDEERGTLFLQFCSTRCPVVHGLADAGPGFETCLDEGELEDLQGLLFMFSVCHAIVYILEGSRVDTHILSKFRVLQAAKHALVPYFKSKSSQPFPSRPHSDSSSSRPPSAAASSSGRSKGSTSRNASSISLMSGLGSYSPLYPGHCTPVILFVFVDDFPDGLNVSSSVEETTEASQLNHSSNSSTIPRSSLPSKGSGSVVVLARPASKSEGGVRKKAQSSIEAQIRFLIKKCRVLSGSEVAHAGGSRGGGAPSSSPLFSFDASRAVVLLDRCTIRGGESLDFATKMVDDVLNGKATSDSLLVESNGHQSANKEDISSIKEFLQRVSDILRGRGGFTNNGSGTGVGMAAVAAAAAAASAASGKSFSSASELPTVEGWLSCSQHLLHGLLSAKHGIVDDMEISNRKTQGVASRGVDPMDFSASLLENATGLNSKFSKSWCERALPTAKDVYMRGLPPCYPTSLHETHLKKALHAFNSMVRGPAVELFARRLEDECTDIWKSGRQLCDAVSLTGKPCMHRRHDISSSSQLLEEPKTHSSGYFFLHACACGRSRGLRPDPFSFESANDPNCFPDCEKGLPVVQLQANDMGPVRSSSWTLIRIGGARYYDPSKGIIQSGFSTTHKFLSKWIVLLEKPTNPNDFSTSAFHLQSVSRPMVEPPVELNSEVDKKKIDGQQFYSAESQSRTEMERKQLEHGRSDEKIISFGMGLTNHNMKKPFSEVVAGSLTRDSGFPPLQQRRHPSAAGSEKSIKQNRSRVPSIVQIHAAFEQGSQKVKEVSTSLKFSNGSSSSVGGLDGDPILRIGSNLVPVNVNNGAVIESNPVVKHAEVYFGFEHECPYGHRFLLNADHLNELGSAYSLHKKHDTPHVETSSQNVTGQSSLGKKGSRGKLYRSSGSVTVASADKVRNAERSKEMRAYGSGSGRSNQSFISAPVDSNLVKELRTDLDSVSIDVSGSEFSMLNRNIPLFMNCPYCRRSKGKKDPKIKFAGTVSQLQRIFLVTPTFPIVLAVCPIIQFEESCLPPSVPDREKKLQFTLGSQVVLPPESFISLRLPFIYGVQLEDGRQHPFGAFEHQPEMTAWIVKGTALHLISKQNSLPSESQT